MATGIELYTKAGAKYFSSDWTSWNFVGSFIATANQTTSVDFPVISEFTEILIQRNFINSPPGNQEAYIHSVSRSNTTVTAAFGTVSGKVATQIVILGR